MDPEQWQQIVQLNGGTIGPPVPQYKVDSTGTRVDDPNPPLRVTFNNGKYIIVQPAPAPGGVGPPEPGAFQVTNQGTAIMPGKAVAPKTTVINGVTYQYNATTGSWEPATGLPTEAPKASTAPKTQVIGGILYQYDQSTNQWTNAQGIPADATTAQKLAIAQQEADARTSSAATAQGRAGTYAANVANNAAAKQAANDLAQARLSWQQIYQGTLAQVAQGKLTLAEAQQVLTEQHQQVSEWLTQRAQDLTYADAQGKTAQALYSDVLTKGVPAGANQSLTDIMNNQGAAQGLKFNLQPGGQTAPDPVNFVQGATQRALQNLQSGNLSSIIGQNPRTVGQPGVPQPMQAQPAATPFVPGNNESPVQPGFSLSSTPAVSPTSQMAPPFGLPR